MSEQVEENILEMAPPPSGEHLKRIEFLAKALAYGAVQDHWSPVIHIVESASGETWFSSGHPNYDERLRNYLQQTWDSMQPQISFLEAFGYLARDADGDYILTPKAFALLETPAAPPSVFISYRRVESSALGLLIVARLKAVGVQNPFIDMNIDPGDEWHARLESTVRQSSYFVCLLGPSTLESRYVRKEIEWALDTEGIAIIPVWHNHYQGGGNYSEGLEGLTSKDAIRVKEESAEEYNNAVVKLLNRLGYTAL